MSTVAGWWRQVTGRPRIEDDAALADALRALARDRAQPAMAAALVRADAIVASATVGVVATDDPRPVGAASRFHLGSTTKGVTALLVAALVREGRLGYDRALGAVLPDVRMREAYRGVTVRDLLLHRGGVVALQDETREDPALVRTIWTDVPRAYADPARQRAEVARVVLDRPPVAPAGVHLYSNVGYALLSHVAETAAGEPFERLLATRIFGPLAMTGARVGGWPASPAEPDQPRGHTSQPGHLLPQTLDDPYVLPAWMNGAGGVHCPIGDYARYARDTLAGLCGRSALLPAADYRAMHAVQATARVAQMYAPSLEALRSAYGRAVDRATCDLGYGWVTFATRGGRVSAGDGSGGTFFARIVVHPSRDIAFVAATSAGDGAAAVADALRVVTGLSAP
jgi:CubicO group peptidase (beta-lactamase class C family)